MDVLVLLKMNLPKYLECEYKHTTNILINHGQTHMSIIILLLNCLLIILSFCSGIV